MRLARASWLLARIVRSRRKAMRKHRAEMLKLILYFIGKSSWLIHFFLFVIIATYAIL